MELLTSLAVHVFLVSIGVVLGIGLLAVMSHAKRTDTWEVER